jgi:hypothetical protein
MAGGTDLELGCSRGAVELVRKTGDLYFTYPRLWLSLAGPVIIPYELIVLLATGNGPLAQGRDGFVAGLIVDLVTIGLIGPLVSALHVRAIGEIGDGIVPRPADVAKASLNALPTVSVAVVLTYFGALLGLVALIVPGVLLWLRWTVVAQAAAMEDEGWKAALRRSRELTKDNYGHVFAVLLLDFLIVFLIGGAFRFGFGEDTTVASFVVGIAVQVVVWSFGALVYGLLYFDLSARFAGAPAAAPIGDREAASTHPSPASVDPGNYTDEDRPPGWYVDPDKPWRMRYWGENGEPGWSGRTTRTPRGTLAEWKDLRWTREKEAT